MGDQYIVGPPTYKLGDQSPPTLRLLRLWGISVDIRLSVPSAHTQRDSPWNSTRRGQRTFLSERASPWWSRWVCAACSIRVRKKTGQTDGRTDRRNKEYLYKQQRVQRGLYGAKPPSATDSPQTWM